MDPAGACPTKPEPTLSFTQGLIVGQLSIVLLLGAFIKFFIFGDAPSPEVTASTRAAERRSRTLAHKRSLLTLRTENPRQPQPTLNKKKSSMLRSPPTLTIGAILDKTYYNIDSHQPESLDWFNVLVAQTIAQFRSDAQQDDAILTSLTKALNGTHRPDFLDEIKVTELTLGEDFPILSNCRIIPLDEDGLSLDASSNPNGGRRFGTSNSRAKSEGVRLQARMDIDLSDMITLALETKLLVNYPKRLTAVLPVALAVSVVRFSGTLCISFIPSNHAQPTPTMMAFNFLDNYQLDLSIRSLVGSRSRLQDVPKIAQLVESRLHKWFDDRCVEPRFQEIALPSLWPRKKNTSGGEDGVESAMTSMGSPRGREISREVMEGAKNEVKAESIERSPDVASLRYRRRGGRMESPSMPGGLPEMQMDLETVLNAFDVFDG